MKIAIASGKGGTGKTTVATNLALSLDNVVLLDCDVEEPDSHLFLQTELKKVAQVNIPVPVVDESTCNHGGDCANFCKFNALAVLPNKVLVFPELCHGCGGCKVVCPENAIDEQDRRIGVVEGGKAKELRFYQGLLDVGEHMATPVISAVKKKAWKKGDTILDAPPGTGCPPIETIKGCDYCILVTEPTPFGLHDLKLAVEMVRVIGIPFGVIINKQGVGYDRVNEYCGEEDIPLLLEIPNDPEIARLYSRGVPFVLEMPEWKERFVALRKRVGEEVEG